VEGRFREDWTLSKLAAEAGLSRGRLAALFKREAGGSIHKLLTKARVRHAEALLANSDLPIGEIAVECGFVTIQHFSRVFRGVNGQTPNGFRRQSASIERWRSNQRWAAFGGARLPNDLTVPPKATDYDVQSGPSFSAYHLIADHQITIYLIVM
jgi:AraC-like DNA-binding protein